MIWDLKQYLALKSHEDNAKKKPPNNEIMSKYLEVQEIARAEILWSFLTLSRNLSFNLSEYASGLSA